jgi:GH24 family phage-related lysozyme (muramidase)
MQLNNVTQRCKRNEGCVLHLYLDSEGFPTIGVGHLVSDLVAALKIQFVNRVTGAPATAAEKEADLLNIRKAPIGLLASTYKKYTKLDISESVSDQLLEYDVQEKVEELLHHHTQMQGYPEPVQEALVDIAFNVGVAGVMKFKHLLAACEAGDWEKAAAACHRKGISEERNDETASLFRQVSVSV